LFSWTTKAEAKGQFFVFRFRLALGFAIVKMQQQHFSRQTNVRKNKTNNKHKTTNNKHACA
jgi:hypothetical protein